MTPPPSREPDLAPSRRTQLLRAAADGELSPAEQRELDALLADHPEEAAVVDFERALRAGVERACQGDPAPAEVGARIEKLARGARLRPLRRLVTIAAAAAAVVLLAVWLWHGRAGDAEERGFTGRGALVRYLATHPRNCVISVERTIREFDVRRCDEAISAVAKLVGGAPDLGGLQGLTQSELEFRGMGRCGIPGGGTSLHLVFAGAAGTPLEGAMVSVYVQRDDGRLPIAEDTTYRLEPRTPDFSGVEMLVWKHGALDFFVVTENPAAARVALARSSARPPTATL
jgi:hypothetical protein